MAGVEGIDVGAESAGENACLKSANSVNSEHVVRYGGGQEALRGAEGREFGAYVGGVFLEDFELFLGAADDLAVETRPGGIEAGAALSCFSDRAMAFGAVTAVGEQFGFADGFADGFIGVGVIGE